MRSRSNQKQGADIIFSLRQIGEILSGLGIGDPAYSFDDFLVLTLQGGKTRRLTVAQIAKKKVQENLTQEDFVALLEKELDIANDVAQKLSEKLEEEIINKRIVNEKIKKHPSDESNNEEISGGEVGEGSQDTYRESVE